MSLDNMSQGVVVFYTYIMDSDASVLSLVMLFISSVGVN